MRGITHIRWSAVGAGIALALLTAAPAAGRACGVLLLPVCQVPAQPVQSGRLLGFNDTGPLDARDGYPGDAFYRWLADAGAAIHRWPVSWQGYEPYRGKVDDSALAPADEVYRRDLAAGVRPLIVLLGTPPWAVTAEARGGRWKTLACDGSRSLCFAPPDVRDAAIRDAWERWAALVAKRYPEAAGFEIWNEPNIRGFWMQRQDPELYGLMLDSAAAAIHAARPGATVVSGGTSEAGASDAYHTPPAEFVRRMYATAPPGSFDALGYHAYPCNARPWESQVALATGEIRAARDRAGDPSRPLWLTETGATTGSPAPANCDTAFTEDEQRDALAAVLDWTGRAEATAGDLPVVLVTRLINGGARMVVTQGSGDSEAEFGIVAWARNLVTGQPVVQAKPAYAAVRCRFRGSC